jgi:hypothetical protein
MYFRPMSPALTIYEINVNYFQKRLHAVGLTRLRTTEPIARELQDVKNKRFLFVMA